MTQNANLAALSAAGVSVWLDDLSRELIQEGELQRLIDEDHVVVDLKTGTLPTAVDRACIMIALSGGLDVPLHYPLSDRPVLSAT